MKKTFKKLLALLMCFTMIMCMVPVTASAAVSKSSTDAINWVESKKGQTLDYDGVYGGQCVDLIYYYYVYLGVSSVGGNASDYTSNSLPSGWARVKAGKNPQKGDILIYAGNGGYGHVAIFETATSTWHQNVTGYTGVCNLSTNYKNIKAGDGSGYWGYIRPDFTDRRSTIVSVTFNANGGTASATKGTFVVGELYGNSLPGAVRDGYTFDGWYTSSSGGTRVISSSTVTSGNKTLYAHWTKNQTGILQVGHVYRIYNEHSGLLLASNGTSDQSLVCQRNKGEKGNGELWRVTEADGNGYYKFESLNGCKALDMDADKKWVCGASLQIYTPKNHDAQKFSIIKRGDKSGYSGLYSIHSKNSGRAIDVSGASKESGAALRQWDYHGGKAELFYFEEVETRNITFYDNYNNNYIASPSEEYEHINSATPTGHYSSRNTDYVKVTLKPDTDSLYIQALKAGSSSKDMKWNTLINGSYTYDFAVTNSSTMVLNFRAKSSVSGAKIYFRWGYESTCQSVTLTNSWADYSVELKRTSVSGNCIHPYIDKACNVEISDISLYEKGTTGYIGDTDAYTSQTVAANVNDDYTCTAPMPKNNRNGYTFNGWYTKRVGGTRVAGALEYFSAPLEGHQKLYAHWTKNAEADYTLSYNANGGTGAPASQSGASSYTVSSTEPTRSGYAFLGWSTSSGATSASYSAGETITISSNTTLYAVWAESITEYTLTYNANGGTSAPSQQVFYKNSVFRISEEKPICFGSTFVGWNTDPNGKGYSYDPGDEVALSESLTLYAMWYTFELDLGDGSGIGTTLVFEDGFDEYYIKVTPTKSETCVVESGSTEYNLDMVGVLYSADGTQLILNDDISDENRNFKFSYHFEAGKTYYIYAKPFLETTGTAYLRIIKAYSVYFDANGGYGAPDALSGDYKYIIPDEEPYRDGYKFLGWTTDTDINYIDNLPGDEVEITGDFYLYAVWQKIASEFYVYYDANGGTNAPQTQFVGSDSIGYIPDEVPVRDGYEFTGWCVNLSGSGSWYFPGDMIRRSDDQGDTTLYAMWSAAETPDPDPEPSGIVTIQTPSITTIRYGDSIILRADFETPDIVSGLKVTWEASNENFKIVSVSDDGKQCIITPVKSGETTFTAKIKIGNTVIDYDTQVMTAKAGFFDKLIAFFKMIFGIGGTVYQQTIDLYK